MYVLRRVRLFATLWTVTHQASLSVGFFRQEYWSSLASLIAWLVKNPPAMQETWVPFLGWEDPLEKEMATHPSILAWRIPWKGILADYSPWGPRVGYDLTTKPPPPPTEWLPFPAPGHPPDPGIEPGSPALAGGFFTCWAIGETLKPTDLLIPNLL